MLPGQNILDKLRRFEETLKSVGLISNPQDLLENFKSICFERFDCPMCKSVFMSRGDCMEHIMMEHPMARAERPLFCEICLKTFADKKSMEQHESYHKRVQGMLHDGEIECQLPEMFLPQLSDLENSMMDLGEEYHEEEHEHEDHEEEEEEEEEEDDEHNGNVM